MSSTCFQPDRPSTERPLYLQLWYGTFYMPQYKQSSRYNSVFEHTLLPSRHVEDLKTNPKFKILIWEMCSSLFYIVKLRTLPHCNNTAGFGQVVFVMMGVEGRHMEKVIFVRPHVSTEIHVNTTEAIFTVSGMNATSLESTQSIDFTSYSQ